MAKKFRAVIFDWSGTLSDDFEACYLTFCDNLKHYGVEPLTMGEYKRRVKLPAEGFTRELGVTASGEKVRDSYYAFFERYKSQAKPFPESCGILEWLKERDVEIAILSAHRHVRREAKDYGFEKYIDVIEEDVANKVDVIHRLVGKMHTHNNETLFVGDMVHDIETARHAGIAVAVVLHGYDSEEKLRAAGPDYVIKTIGELKNLGLF